MSSSKFFKLFATCVPVKGAKNHVICDLDRKDIYKIPEGLYEILTLLSKLDISEIKKYYDNEVDAQIDNYIKYLTENELGFICSNPQNFPDINLIWKSPSRITNAILEINRQSNYLNKEVINQFEELGCKFFEIRFYEKIELFEVIEILNLFEESIVRNIHLFLPYNKEFNSNNLRDLVLRHQRVGHIHLHSFFSDYEFDEDLEYIVSHTKSKITDNSHCGVISKNFFAVDLRMFSESQEHNSCLNRKLSINVDGIIKNCPSLPNQYGNVSDTPLIHAINNDFKKLWVINKSTINVCQDCEFRFVCTDCRAFLEDPSDILSKPLKCGYNPYNGTWDDWSTNPNKMKTIVHYNLLSDEVKSN